MYSKLQYISQGSTAQEQITNIHQCLDAGCDWIQLRFINAAEKELQATAKQVKKLCDSYDATLIINDNAGLAHTIDASGVHLGLQDMSISKAREILGPQKIIGGTANTIQDVLSQVEKKCDYIGLGPFRFTSTKKKLSPVLGATGIGEIMKVLSQREIKTPVFAIGGILLSDVENILEHGAFGVAVSGEITKHSSKKELLEKFNLLLNGKINNS